MYDKDANGVISLSLVISTFYQIMITFFIVFIIARAPADIIARTSNGSFFVSVLVRD